MIKVWRCWNCEAYNHASLYSCHNCGASSDQAQWQFTLPERGKKIGGVYVKAKDYAKKVLDEQRAATKAKFGETWTLPEGESRIAIDLSREIDDVTTQYGVSARLPVVVNKKKTTWLINKRNPTLRQLMTYIVSGKSKFQITRTGKGTATRYSVKAL